MRISVESTPPLLLVVTVITTNKTGGYMVSAYVPEYGESRDTDSSELIGQWHHDGLTLVPAVRKTLEELYALGRDY